MDIFDSVEQSMAENDKVNPPLYKKWFNAKGRKGFLTLKVWDQAEKISVDIGEISGQGDAQQVASTLIWTGLYPLAAYLDAYSKGMLNLYGPSLTHTTYGGSVENGKPVSRLFKLSPWGLKNPNALTENLTIAQEVGFQWKVGKFQATVTGQGAYTPKMDAKISENLIKVNPQEMLEINMRLTKYLFSK